MKENENRPIFGSRNPLINPRLILAYALLTWGRRDEASIFGQAESFKFEFHPPIILSSNTGLLATGIAFASFCTHAKPPPIRHLKQPFHFPRYVAMP